MSALPKPTKPKPRPFTVEHEDVFVRLLAEFGKAESNKMPIAAMYLCNEMLRFLREIEA